MSTTVQYKEGKHLTEQAMLVRLQVHSWDGRITDKEVTADVANRAGAPGNPSDVGQLCEKVGPQGRPPGHQQARRGNALNAPPVHHALGRWLLPAAPGGAASTVRPGHGQADGDAYLCAESPLDGLGRTRRRRRKVRLGTLFNSTNYPTRAELGHKVTHNYAFAPVPDAKHFAVSAMGHEIQERIKEDFEKQVQAKIQGTVVDLYRRLHDAATAITERLQDDADGNPKVFRDSLVKNVSNILDILPALNMTEDSALNNMGDEIRKAIDGVQPDDLRPKSKNFHPGKRQEVKDVAADISERLSSYFGPLPT